MKPLVLHRASLAHGIAPKLASMTRAFWFDRRGVAAIELCIFAVFLSAALANVTDVSVYIYQRMQVENATQVSGQAALKTCGNSLPATTNCSSLMTAMQAALQSTSLGTAVTFASGSPTEGYYCINSSGSLQFMSGVSSKPTDCSGAGMPTLQPGDYIVVNTMFTYQPFFPGISVTSTFATPITRTAMLRLG